MKSLYLFFLSVGIGVFTVGCEKSAAYEVEVVTVEEMKTQLQYNELQVVDVRPQEEYKKSHLINAQNIIYDKNFRKNLERLDKTKPIAIYCTSGTVSPEAAEILQEAGFSHIYILDGGISRWMAEEDKPMKQ